MLELKLNAQVAEVKYNSVGVLVSEPVQGAPNKVKATNHDIIIKGYVLAEGFFAKDIDIADDKVQSLSAKLSLLTMLGFKTVPFTVNPKVAGEEDKLIAELQRYAIYSPVWIDSEGKEYKLPQITVVKGVNWGVDGKGRLTMQLNTDLGEFSVIDHRYTSAFQVGCTIKIANGEALPMVTRPIVDNVPTHCPNCNNPLHTFQFDNTLPKIIKCKAPMCKLLSLKPEDAIRDAKIEEEVVLPEEETTEANVGVNVEETVSEEVRVDENANTVNETEQEVSEARETVPAYVIIAETDIPDSIKDKVRVVELGDVVPDYIVAKSKNSVTRKVRNFAKENDVSVITITELEEMLNG